LGPREKRYLSAAEIFFEEDPSGMMATAITYKRGSVAIR